MYGANERFTCDLQLMDMFVEQMHHLRCEATVSRCYMQLINMFVESIHNVVAN